MSKSISYYKRSLMPDNGEPVLYQPLEHPAFREWKSQQPCIERWQMISDSLRLDSTGTVVDLGCHTGWFCRRFSQVGWKAVGIDRNPLAIDIARNLMGHWNGSVPPEYILGSLFDIAIPPSDVALCLSLVMYLFDTEVRGWQLMRRISQSCQKMYLDFGGMYADRVPFDRNNVVEQVISNTEYSKGTLLGTTGLEDRPFYLFEA